MREMTPREIVAELDSHIIGQQEAKRAVAIAVRNRWRRQKVQDEMRQDINPKNIMMIGPTGVGKTEIARRLARMLECPFIKVEASKYTEVGYYGRDVESMIRELVESAIQIVRRQEKEHIADLARKAAIEKLAALLVGPAPVRREFNDEQEFNEAQQRYERTCEKMAAMVDADQMNDKMVELAVEKKMPPMMIGSIGPGDMDLDLHSMLEKIIPSRSARKTMKVQDAYNIIFEQECDAHIDQDKVNTNAITLAENSGMIFIDEIDKIVGSDKQNGADVSRQGVQRDLLPLVEGTTVQTKYGYVKTDHVLFIAAGAFHQSKPNDLMPELQGRFPIRVELSDLSEEDFVQILTFPRNSLLKQYEALLATENVTLDITPEAVAQLAYYAHNVNQKSQNIGARRLHTILERLLEQISFDAPDKSGENFVIDADYVHQRLESIAGDEDLSRFIL